MQSNPTFDLQLARKDRVRLVILISYINYPRSSFGKSKWRARPEKESQEQSVCTFDNFHLTFNSKSKLLREVLRMTKLMSIDISILFLNVTWNLGCLVIRVFSNMSVDVWFFLQKSHYVSNSKVCMSIDVHFYLCKILRVQRDRSSHWHRTRQPQESGLLAEFQGVNLVLVSV